MLAHFISCIFDRRKRVSFRFSASTTSSFLPTPLPLLFSVLPSPYLSSILPTTIHSQRFHSSTDSRIDSSMDQIGEKWVCPNLAER